MFARIIDNDVSVETVTSIMKLLIADKFKNMDDVNSNYAKVLRDIKSILEDDKTEDFECIEKIVVIFEHLDIGVEYRHDFGLCVKGYTRKRKHVPKRTPKPSQPSRALWYD